MQNNITKSSFIIKMENIFSKFVNVSTNMFNNSFINKIEKNKNENNSEIINNNAIVKPIQNIKHTVDFNIYLKCFIHELNTPLSTISLGINLLDENNNKNKQTIYDIKQSIILLENILNKFIIIQDNYIVLNEFKSFSLVNMMKHIEKVLQNKFAEDDVTFFYNIHSNVNDYVYGDKYNIIICVINLLKNALKYRDISRKNKIFIQIEKINNGINDPEFIPSKPKIEKRKHIKTPHNNSMRKTIQNEKYQTLKISVYDENNHISPEIKQNLFKIFNTTSDSGLGLYICKTIIELHGGKIYHEYIEKNGNIFIITIPLKIIIDIPILDFKKINLNQESNIINSLNIICNTNNDEQIKDTSIVNLEKYNILLIDDSILNQKMIYKTLDSLNLFNKIYFEYDGMGIIEFIMENNRDIKIIFMDKYMPIMGGIQCSLNLRRLKYNFLIFGITGDIDDEKNEFIKAGADYVFIKPLNGDKIKLFTDFLYKYGTTRPENKKIQNINNNLEWV
jgi:signal transduction histidine kinase